MWLKCLVGLWVAQIAVLAGSNSYMLKLCLYKASHLLVLLQNYSCISNSSAAACVQAKIAANEEAHAKQIKSWQTQVEMEEERAERMASCLRTDLEEKDQELKVNLKPPS